MTKTQTALDIANNAFLGITPLELKRIDLTLDQISISQLLGRDYVFIDVRNSKTAFANARQLTCLLENMIKDLSLSEGRTLFITVDENPAKEPQFTRHEIHWQQHLVEHIESVHIDTPEQEDFMSMIWQCSTPFAS